MLVGFESSAWSITVDPASCSLAASTAVTAPAYPRPRRPSGVYTGPMRVTGPVGVMTGSACPAMDTGSALDRPPPHGVVLEPPADGSFDVVAGEPRGSSELLVPLDQQRQVVGHRRPR